MPTPLLPRLNDANAIAIARRGEWISENQNSLPNLIKSLKVTTDRQASVTSIPDLWAHPAMVEMALMDKGHPKHNFYLNQWRGILAMIALYSARNIKELEVKKYKIPPIASLKGQDVPEFLKVLAGLATDKIKKYDTSVNGEYQIQVITYSKKALAFVWPSIFICPAVEISENMVQGSAVSWWFKNIDNPIPKLSQTEKIIVKDWIENAKRHVSIHESGLLDLLVDFEKELGDLPDRQFDKSTGLDFVGYCNFLSYNRKMPMDKSFVESSNVKLIKLKKSAAKLPELLVITPDMDVLWHQDASQIVIAGSTTLDAVKSLCCGGVIIDKTNLNGYDIGEFAQLRSSEDFFTEKICIVSVNSDEENLSGEKLFANDWKPIQKVLNGCRVNIVLPIKKEVLDYLTTSYIKDNVEVEVEGTSIVVTLYLTLSGINGETKLRVSKTYESENQKLVTFVPLIQLWPDFITTKAKNAILGKSVNNAADENKAGKDRWEAYYSYFSAPEGWERTDIFYACPLWNDVKPRVFIDEAKRYGEIIRGSSFPEAYVCYDVEEEAKGQKRTEIGLLLIDINKPKVLNDVSTTKKCRIGVDFGTSNTTSYYSINDGEPDLLRFDSRLFDITNIKVENKANLRRNFFSKAIQPCDQEYARISSIRSIYHTYEGNADKDSKKPMMSGNIYFLETGNNINADRYLVDKNSLHDDIKWNVDGVVHMTSFMVQYAMQCLAEATVLGATHVEWIYSYPKSYTERQVKLLSTIWEQSVIPQMNLINKLSTEITSKSKREESVAMAEFFSNKMKGNVERGMVCFDIGGGSTDIAVWQGSEKNGMRYQCSLKFAGRNILNDYLFIKKNNKKALLTNLRSHDKEYNNILASVNDADKKDFNLKLEALLKYYENEIFTLLNHAASETGSEMSIVSRDIAFGIAGILYYSGYVISYLKTLNAYDEKKKLPYCYVGGNASKLLDWAGIGHFDEHIADRFAICFAKGMDSFGEGHNLDKESTSVQTYRPKVIKTNAAKEEVAYGLVKNSYITEDSQEQSRSDDGWDFGDNDTSNVQCTIIGDILAGEEFAVDDDLPETEIISVNSLVDSKIRINEKCPRFKMFLESFDKAFKGIFPALNLSENDLSQICQEVNKELNIKHRNGEKDKENIIAEPLFIMILREAMKKLAEK